MANVEVQLQNLNIKRQEVQIKELEAALVKERAIIRINYEEKQ